MNAVPDLSVAITTNGSSDEGERYSLTCSVEGDVSLAVSNRTFEWNRSGAGIQGMPNPAGTLTFDPLYRNDTGAYRCTATITSPYLIETHTVMDSRTVTVNCKGSHNYRFKM